MRLLQALNIFIIPDFDKSIKVTDKIDKNSGMQRNGKPETKLAICILLGNLFIIAEHQEIRRCHDVMSIRAFMQLPGLMPRP